MIFSCGETREHKEKRLSHWHPWFAWYPVTVDDQNGFYRCVWLQTVMRRKTYQASYGGSFWVSYYKMPKDLGVKF